MKLSLITLHSIYNPGSALQAFALQKYLDKVGCDNEIIDYRPAYSTVGKNKIKGHVRNLLYNKNRKKVKAKYESFILDNMTLSPIRYTKYSELESQPPRADLYLTGSDQLWNLDYDCGRDPAYYLQFAKGNKAAYSTSIGKKEVPANEQTFLQRNLADFKHIAVRERSNSELLTILLNKDVKWVCDPVFLLNGNEYMPFISDNTYGDYAVVYLSAKSKLLDDVIKEVRKKYGVKIIQAGGYTKRCDADELISTIGPKDFLSLIYHTRIVICSSFHAIAYSHIFHKNFIVLLPRPNGERITSLLSLSGLGWKIVNDIKDFDIASQEPDFNKVDVHLSPFIENSKEYLTSIIDFPYEQ